MAPLSVDVIIAATLQWALASDRFPFSVIRCVPLERHFLGGVSQYQKCFVWFDFRLLFCCYLGLGPV